MIAFTVLAEPFRKHRSGHILLAGGFGSGRGTTLNAANA
jgi:hypothetical protein